MKLLFLLILLSNICQAQEYKLPEGMSAFNTSEMKYLKTEEWEGQIETLKLTIKHLLNENKRLIFEIQKCGLSIDVSSMTCEIEIIKGKKYGVK